MLCVICSFPHEGIKGTGIQKWIPYGVFYACADAAAEGEGEKVKLFGSLELPAMVFKLWWILPVALLFIPVNGTVENVITIVLNVVFLGCSYAKMYAKLEGKQESETQAIGCVSGLIPIIAVVKFLSYKGNN